jgi:hypothetical protein
LRRLVINAHRSQSSLRPNSCLRHSVSSSW